MISIENPESTYPLLESLFRLFTDNHLLYILTTLVLIVSLVCFFDHAVSLSFCAMHNISLVSLARMQTNKHLFTQIELSNPRANTKIVKNYFAA